MAAPILQATSTATTTGTSVAVPATTTAPIIGDYRIHVITIYDHVTSGVSTSVNITNVPTGWSFLYQSPKSAGNSRSYVYGKKWQTTDVSVTWNFSQNVPYLSQVVRVSGYNLASNGPIVAVPRGQATQGTTTQLKSLGLIAEADAIRIDFYAAYFGSNANTTATIATPVGQSASAVARPSTTNGYVGRIGFENTTGYGYTGDRTATTTPTMSNGMATGVIVGGWKVLTKGSTKTLGITHTAKGTKKVTLNSATNLALEADFADGTGRHSTGYTTTDLGVMQTSKRVYLTRTTMGLTSSSTGSHHADAFSRDLLGVETPSYGIHTAGSVETLTQLNVTATAAGRIGGGGPPTPSYVDQFTQTYEPTTKPLRFLFQGIRNGQWLNWDVPLLDPEITFTLTGASMIRGKIGPEDADAVQGINAWATWLHCEEGGEIRASGILQPLAVQGDDLVVEAVGIMGYPVGMPFVNEYSAILADPADIIRFLWTNVQGFTDGNLHVTLDDTHTPRRLGEDETVTVHYDSDGKPVYKYADIYEGTTDKIYTKQEGFPIKAWNLLAQWGYTIYQDTAQNNAIVMLVYPPDWAWATCELPAQIERSTTDNGDGTSTVVDKWMIPEFDFVAQKPYELSWWNEVDIGSEIQNLAKQTPMDLSEGASWTADRLGVDHHVNIGYPRLGARRTDLRFAEDENVLAAVLLREQPDWYASQIMVRGAGEGRLAVRAQSGAPDPVRIRRYKSMSDKTITTAERAQAVADDEYRRRLALLTITEITIDATHDNAPMGSFQVGDDIMIQAYIPYFDDIQLWHRITSYSWKPDTDEVTLQLKRSESFAYGRVTST